MRRLQFLFLLICSSSLLRAQLLQESISQDYVEKTIRYLASDKLEGRVNYSKEQLEAADFIGTEFTKFGLLPFPGMQTYFLPFNFKKSYSDKSESLIWNGRFLADSDFYFFSNKLVRPKLQLSDFFILQASAPLADSLIIQHWDKKEKLLIWIKLDSGQSLSSIISNLLLPKKYPASDILIVADKEAPIKLNYSGNEKKLLKALHNVVGVLPGKSKPDEMIIFSAHYDHINTGDDFKAGNIYNGANDNASGTTGVLALAKYFAAKNDNERTLVFCLFAGEELGLLGSKAFVNLVDPEKIVTVINIEMIGQTNASGKNAFIFTGAGHSGLYKIYSKNLRKSEVKVKKLSDDPSNLFYRSDNLPFHLLGIPSHTIMCSNDNEPCYHKECDDVGRIDIRNMTNIIKAIASGASSIISGIDTPEFIEK